MTLAAADAAVDAPAARGTYREWPLVLAVATVANAVLLFRGWGGLRTPWIPVNLGATGLLMLHAIVHRFRHAPCGRTVLRVLLLAPGRALAWLSVWGMLAILGFSWLWTPGAWIGSDPMFEPVARLDCGWRRIEAIRVNPAAFRPFHIHVMTVTPLVPGVLEFWRGLHTEGHAEEVRMELHGDDLQLTFSEAEVRTRHVRLR